MEPRLKMVKKQANAIVELENELIKAKKQDRNSWSRSRARRWAAQAWCFPQLDM